VAVLACAAPATAAQSVLWPGVTYERGVQLTPHGPVALSIIRGPRPGGTTTLEPLLSNDSLLGRETLSAMQRRTAGVATTAGVNGDFFTVATGRPNGVLMRAGELVAPPRSSRSSAGITSDGTLDVRRVGFFGSWAAGAGPKRPLGTLNEIPTEGGSALLTEAYGPTTPRLAGATQVVLFPLPLAVPNTDLAGTVGLVTTDGAPLEIPPGGGVLVARGAQAAQLAAEALLGEQVVVRLQLKPDWPDVVGAIGGGPQIVRGGVPVFRAGEAFTSLQLTPRAPRTAVGQTAAGRILLVTVDGRQPGLSVGLTNFELAQALVRLGAVTGMALDGGGSTTMAFDGRVLNRPSDGRERPIATGLVLAYTGVFLPQVPSRVSPNGDGVDDSPGLAVRLVRPATLTTRLLGPTGVVLETTEARQPGTTKVALPGEGASTAATGVPLAVGTWRLEATAVDDLGQTTRMSRSFVVDDTLGFLRLPRRHVVRDGGQPLTARFRLAREARVTLRVETPAGTLVRSLTGGRLPAGEATIAWDGRLPKARLPRPGTYVVRVVATGAAGRSELSGAVRIAVAAGTTGATG
jgi:hypothetical protein